jgi:hypothetical protein
LVEKDFSEMVMLLKKIPTVLLATISGVAIESVLCVIALISVFAGGVGPCGPSGNAPAFVRIIHQPGFLLAGLFVEDSSPLYLLLTVASTAVLLSILAYIVLRFGRNGISKAGINSAPAYGGDDSEKK